MFRFSSRIFERDIVKTNLFLKLDTNTGLRVLSVGDLGLPLNDLEDKGTEGFCCHKTLDVREGSDKANEACDQSNEDREHIFLVVRLSRL